MVCGALHPPLPQTMLCWSIFFPSLSKTNLIVNIRFARFIETSNRVTEVTSDKFTSNCHNTKMLKIARLMSKLLAKIYSGPSRPWLICFWPATTKKLCTPALVQVLLRACLHECSIVRFHPNIF